MPMRRVSFSGSWHRDYHFHGTIRVPLKKPRKDVILSSLPDGDDFEVVVTHENRDTDACIPAAHWPIGEERLQVLAFTMNRALCGQTLIDLKPEFREAVLFLSVALMPTLHQRKFAFVCLHPDVQHSMWDDHEERVRLFNPDSPREMDLLLTGNSDKFFARSFKCEHMTSLLSRDNWYASRDLPPRVLVDGVEEKPKSSSFQVVLPVRGKAVSLFDRDMDEAEKAIERERQRMKEEVAKKEQERVREMREREKAMLRAEKEKQRVAREHRQKLLPGQGGVVDKSKSKKKRQ